VTDDAGPAGPVRATAAAAVTGATAAAVAAISSGTAMTVTERVASWGVRTGLPPPPWTARGLSRSRNRDRRAAGIGGTTASGGGDTARSPSMTPKRAAGQEKWHPERPWTR
jgi:hypothetical protein